MLGSRILCPPTRLSLPRSPSSFPPTTSAIASPISSHAVFGAYAAAGLDAELIVVDDNSPDGTGALADELARQHRHAGRFTGAASSGSAPRSSPASRRRSAPIVGVIDADLSHPPALLPRMLDVMHRESRRRRHRQPLHSRRRHAQLAARPAGAVAPRLRAGPAADAGARRDLRVLPDSPRPRARRAHLGRRVQDLPGAAGARPAVIGRRSALRVRGTHRGREQDEPEGSARLPAAAARPAAVHRGAAAAARSATAAISRRRARR